MPNYLSYEKFVTMPVPPIAEPMKFVLPQLLTFYRENANIPDTLKAARSSAGVSYHQQLNTMLRAKLLFTGSRFHFYLTDTGMQVAKKLLRYDLYTMDIVSNEQLQSTHITTNQVKSIAQGIQWYALSNDAYVPKTVGNLYKAIHPQVNELTPGELEILIKGLIRTFEVKADT